MSVPAEHRAPTFLEKLRRASDRLVTPNVIIALIVVVGAVVVYSVHAAVQAELHGGRGRGADHGGRAGAASRG